MSTLYHAIYSSLHQTPVATNQLFNKLELYTQEGVLELVILHS